MPPQVVAGTRSPSIRESVIEANVPGAVAERAEQELFETARRALLIDEREGERVYVCRSRLHRLSKKHPIEQINLKTGEKFRPTPEVAQFEDGIYRTTDAEMQAHIEKCRDFGGTIRRAKDVIRQHAQDQVSRVEAMLEEIPEALRGDVLKRLRTMSGKDPEIIELPPREEVGGTKPAAPVAPASRKAK